mgnify:CR=1 FL=1
MKILVSFLFVVLLGLTSCSSKKEEIHKSGPIEVKTYVFLPAIFYRGSGMFEMRSRTDDITSFVESFIETNKKILKPLNIALVHETPADSLSDITRGSYLLFCEIKSPGYVKKSKGMVAVVLYGENGGKDADSIMVR